MKKTGGIQYLGKIKVIAQGYFKNNEMQMINRFMPAQSKACLEQQLGLLERVRWVLCDSVFS
ncbi:hypothetical protein [Methylobacter tundripaludum]|uniref:hypothetical protein n=1 Tax=Methylobacter tundripaludum TaxID=173365 RepID=UPI0002E3118A|nr:hypothetical protein [Methylobacter tundripaludum]